MRGVRSSRIASTSAIFAGWSVGTTSSRVRTCAIMPPRSGSPFASASRASTSRASSGESVKIAIGVRYSPSRSFIRAPQ